MASVELVPWFLKWEKSRGSSGPMSPIAGHGWILATKSHFRGRRSTRIERGTEKHPVAAICTAHHGCPGAVLSSFVACAPALLRCPCQLRGDESNDETGCLGLPAEPTGMGRTEMERKGPHARAAFPNPSIHVTHCRPPPPKPPIRALVSASCKPSDDGPCPFCHFHPIPLRFTFGPTGPIRQHRHNPR